MILTSNTEATENKVQFLIYMNRERDRQREKEHKQTDGQIDRQTDRQTDRQSVRPTDLHAYIKNTLPIIML